MANSLSSNSSVNSGASHIRLMIKIERVRLINPLQIVEAIMSDEQLSSPFMIIIIHATFMMKNETNNVSNIIFSDCLLKYSRRIFIIAVI